MGIQSSYFLFDPKGFAEAIILYIKDSQRNQENFFLLSSAAINLFDMNSHVRQLCDEYGSWDRKGLLEQQKEYPRDPSDVVFWLIILLYSQLRDPEVRNIELLNSRQLVRKTLNLIGWDNDEIDTLANGRNFQHFANEWLLTDSRSFSNDTDFQEYWQHFHPPSTSSSIGWLGLADIRFFLQKLSDGGDQLSNLMNKHDTDPIDDIYATLRNLLTTAQNHNSGICIITSG